jgi:hypothetical protein
MKLRDVVEPGDILLIYPKPKQLLGKIIAGATFGKVTHACIVVDKDTIFETDGDMFKAQYQPLSKYAGRHVIIIAAKSLQGKEHDIKVRCEVYKGAPYSYWDIATNGVFFWLAAPLRKKVVGFLGNKNFMLCSELTTRIAYDVGHHKSLREYEGLTPEDFRQLALLWPEEYQYQDFQATA